MPNMSYIQFENTYDDLRQCYEAMDEEDEGREAKYKKLLIELCVKIAQEYGEENA